jgi:hypothetical protein
MIREDGLFHRFIPDAWSEQGNLRKHVKIAVSPDGIQTRYLPNTSLNRHRRTKYSVLSPDGRIILKLS